MANQRNFRPRSPIPKDKLISELETGKTLEEIGIRFGRSRSFVSECCTMYNIDIDKIDGREKKKKKRKSKKKKQSFVDVMYKKIKREL